VNSNVLPPNSYSPPKPKSALVSPDLKTFSSAPSSNELAVIDGISRFLFFFLTPSSS